MLNSALLNEGLTSLFNSQDPLETFKFLVKHYDGRQSNIQSKLQQSSKVHLLDIFAQELSYGIKIF